MSDPAPVSVARPGLVLLVVAGGTLLSTLAGSSITLALPAIGRDLGLPIDLTRWVMIAFLLSVTVSLLVAGRAGDLLGHRRLYLGGFLLFGLTSLACGLARGFPMLVGGRVLQGMAGAMVMAAGPALITTTLPSGRRGRSLGLLATATYVGLTVAPSLGGWLVGAFGWRSVFLINVPVALAIVVTGTLLLPPGDRRRKVALDASGALTLLFGAPLLLLAFTEGPRWGWTSPPTLICGAAGGLTLVGFVLLQSRRPEPLLDVSLFRSRMFSAAAASALCNYVALFVPIILLPFYLLEGLRASPSVSGLVLSAQSLAMALVASPAGWISDRIGTRGLAATGLAVLALGVGALATIDASSGAPTISLWLALMGLGTGIFISPNSSALMGAAPHARQGVAGAVMAVARNLGMMIGVSAGTEVFRALGGRTGAVWRPLDTRALRHAFAAAAVVSALGALIVLVGGKAKSADE